MLQQTQVHTVFPYYRRFLAAFPNITALDRARTDKVLALWSGLGYYRRAIHLKKSAKLLVRHHHGTIPPDYQKLLKLPGIGTYTAGALMSIAFNGRYPALDGNAKRVISRLFNLKTEGEIREAANLLVPRIRPGHFNQALMDLGSGICHPRKPRCSQCPLSNTCAAYASGKLLSPRPNGQTKLANIEWPMVIIHRQGKILFHRRDDEGLLRGLWELPGGQRQRKESVGATLNRHLEVPGRVTNGFVKIGEVRHSMTRYKIVSPLFISDCCPPGFQFGSKWRWVPVASVSRYPLSSLSLKGVRLFNQHHKRRLRS